MGPPADSEYAVEPVGVAITIPSARYAEISSPLSESSRSTIRAVEPFDYASFKANVENFRLPVEEITSTASMRAPRHVSSRKCNQTGQARSFRFR